MLRCFAFFLCCFCLYAPVHAQVIEGSARVVDGDTIDMTGTRIRIAYIDAPETQQTCMKGNRLWHCGAAATSELADIIDGEAISCAIITTDKYKRKVAICRTRVFDLGKEMLRRGMAVQFGGGPAGYHKAVEIAQSMRAGLWSSTFTVPAQWRQQNPRKPHKGFAASNPASQPRQSRACNIKGNHSRRGDWIYHMPGQTYYNVTRAEEMFCSEAEARAAGYRKARS